MQVERLDLRLLSAEDALAIGRLIVKVWPKPGKDERFRQRQMISIGQDYCGPEQRVPLSFVVREKENVIAHAAVIPRNIVTSQGELTIAGLCKVCSDPKLRGQGLGELVVRKVFDMVDADDFRFSLFQTTPLVSPFYERLGACAVENHFVNSFASNLRECPFWDEVIMRYPSDREWPSGEIDLCGPGY